MSLFNIQEDNRTEAWKVESYMEEGERLTRTLEAQDETLQAIFPYLHGKSVSVGKILDRNEHIRYLLRGLQKLPSGYASLDASQPWLVYWMLQSLALLKYDLYEGSKQRVIETISKMQNPSGGFGGGPGQVSHLAATYAAIMSLMLIGGKQAYNIIDKPKLLEWFKSLKNPDGSFLMCLNGETDIRGSYCVVSTAKLLNINDQALFDKVDIFIINCQGFDGGLGCYPGVESHGGYTYCGLATLELLNKVDQLNFDYLITWCCNRQTYPEGGFQGRTNKLVDGCYSFWLGATFPIISANLNNVDVLNRDALQTYILNACQGPVGGLRDKPGKGVDYYHTCYVLSGLSISQYKYTIEYYNNIQLKSNSWKASLIDNTQPSNILAATHPLYNIPIDKVNLAFDHFYK